MIKVFLSSVSRGLEEPRARALSALRTAGYEVLNMEAFGARPEQSIEVCLREVRRADVVVIIVGPRYGSKLPDSDISYTRAEYRHAMESEIPVLAFLLPVDPGAPEEEKALLEGFRAEVGRALLYKETELPDLRADILSSLTWVRDQGALAPPSGIFQAWRRFFRAELDVERARIFNHQAPFVGRDAELAELTAFLESDETVRILTAAGGCGKSRLLLELARLSEGNKQLPKILFADPIASWTAEDINALPSVASVLVLDDAHRRANLDGLLNTCMRARQHLRFLISCRPGAVPFVLPHLSSVVATGDSLTPIELKPLSREAALDLAARCLTTKYEGLAERLISVSGGNPLFISVGARCIVEEAVPPELLVGSSEKFKAAALDRMVQPPWQDAGEAARRIKLLRLLSTIGPVPDRHQQTIERLAHHLNCQGSELVAELASLEAEGLIRRRASTLRVVPDVLADHLLHRAAVTDAGEPTGYVEEIQREFGDGFLGNILANAAELGWKGEATGKHGSVLEQVWRAIIDELPNRTNVQREELLDDLTRAARYSPEEVLRVIEWLRDHPDAPRDKMLEAWGIADSSERLNDSLSGLLRVVATHPDYTRQAVAILWEMAKEDARPTNPHPAHPRRVLEDLLSYDFSRSAAVQRVAVATVIEKLKDSRRTDQMAWAVALLRKPLERHVNSTAYRRRVVTLGSGPLGPYLSTYAEFRREVVAYLQTIARTLRLAEALAAIKILGSLLHRPEALFGREVDDDELDAWVPEATAGADILSDIASTAALPFARYAARRELREFLPVRWPDLARVIESVLIRTPTEPSEQLFDILMGAPWQERDDDWPAEQARFRDECERAASEFWVGHDASSSVVGALLSVYEGLGETVRTDFANEGMLVSALIRANVEQGASFLEALVAKGNDTAMRLVPLALFALHRAGREEQAYEFVRRTGSSDDARLRASVAGSLRSLIRDGGASADVLNLVSSFLNDEVPNVRRLAVFALPSFAKSAPLLALELVVKVNWDGDQWLADAVCEVLRTHHGLDASLLTDEQIDVLLAQVEQLPTLEAHMDGVLAFVAYASGRRPEQTLSTLLRRVEAAERTSGPTGTSKGNPIPHSAHNLSLSGFRQSGRSRDLLRRIRDAFPRMSALGAYWLSTLFHAAASSNEDVVAVLKEWAESLDPAEVISAASLLGEFDHATVFSLHELVATLLEAGERHGSACYESVAGALCRLAIGGVYSGGTKGPSPRLLNDKAEAARLAAFYANSLPVRQFYEDLVRHAEDSIKREAEQFEEEDDE